LETVYEGMFILDSSRYARDPSIANSQIPKLIEQFGGQLLVNRLWDERRLAYPIEGQRKGTYWLTYFRLEGNRLHELKRQCEIDDAILRHLFLKIDPRIVDALVEHAKSSQAQPKEVSKDALSEQAEAAKAKARARIDNEGPDVSTDDDKADDKADDGGSTDSPGARPEKNP